jgi:hypothetical protein
MSFHLLAIVCTRFAVRHATPSARAAGATARFGLDGL